MTTANFFKNQQGFADVARRVALKMGQPPAFRDFVEAAIGRMQMPFGIRAAMGHLSGEQPLDKLVQSPEAFEAFLKHPGQAEFQDPDTWGGNQISRTLNSAARYLRQPTAAGDVRTGAGQDLLRQLLLGPSGSVGSELFAPTIGMVTQGAGRRFLPGLGQAARNAVQNSLQNMLAQEPGRFTDLPAFIDFLINEGIISRETAV